MEHFIFYQKKDLESYIAPREGEVKLGEAIHYVQDRNWEKALENPEAKYVIIGIPEDIGVKANHGIAGTATLWQPFLRSFLNVQQTNILQGKNILLLGYFDFQKYMEKVASQDITELSALVTMIDDMVFPLIQKIVAADKIPLIIGGGHNNAYPLLKGASLALATAINCVNLDAHSDYRKIEGRHSGNGFRYAKMEGYLKRYAMIGLHENYNSQNVLDDINADEDMCFYTYEDIFLRELIAYKKVMNEVVYFLKNQKSGVELDLDAIENTLSSAMTPCGITTLQARQYIIKMAQSLDVAYLHLAEGAVALHNGKEQPLTAKLMSYLITDFIKAHHNKQQIIA